MARFNTQQSTILISSTTTLTYVIDKSTILLTGSSGYTLTLADPAMYPGSTQNIYNDTGGNVTIATASGTLIGNGFTGAATQIIPNNSSYSATSNGTNYIIVNNQGGPIAATTASFSGTVDISPSGAGTVSINPGTTGAINNINIGTTTRGTGAFTSLQANNAVTLNNITIAQNSGTITTSTGNLTLDAANGSTISVNKALSMGSNQISSSYTPASGNDLTNKTYVDLKGSKISAAGLYYGS